MMLLACSTHNRDSCSAKCIPKQYPAADDPGKKTKLTASYCWPSWVWWNQDTRLLPSTSTMEEKIWSLQWKWSVLSLSIEQLHHTNKGFEGGTLGVSWTDDVHQCQTHLPRISFPHVVPLDHHGTQHSDCDKAFPQVCQYLESWLHICNQIKIISLKNTLWAQSQSEQYSSLPSKSVHYFVLKLLRHAMIYINYTYTSGHHGLAVYFSGHWASEIQAFKQFHNYIDEHVHHTCNAQEIWARNLHTFALRKEHQKTTFPNNLRIFSKLQILSINNGRGVAIGSSHCPSPSYRKPQCAPYSTWSCLSFDGGFLLNSTTVQGQSSENRADKHGKQMFSNKSALLATAMMQKPEIGCIMQMVAASMSTRV